jgi:hypothetical protein
MSTSTPTKQAWTPGPWQVTPTGYRVMWVGKQSDGTIIDSSVICDTATNNASRTKQNAANAKLIAKAPQSTEKLLEFYEAAKSWHSVHGHGRDSVQCDEFCRLMNEAEPVLREAGAL